MRVRKFYAVSAREALREVRTQLGPNALILSNRKTSTGVEIMAVPEAEVDAVTMSARAAPPAARRASASPAQPPARAAAATPIHTVSVRAPAAASAPAQPSPQRDAPSFEPPPYDLVQEVRILRSMLEGQLAAFAWNDLSRAAPAKIEVLRQLLAAGFSAGFARGAVESIPPGLDAARAFRLVKQSLQQQLRMLPPEVSPVDRGGVYALVGPTGVGKTTTVAKIAAECTLKRGAQSVALVTTDTYRIGAVDQLRI